MQVCGLGMGILMLSDWARGAKMKRGEGVGVVVRGWQVLWGVRCRKGGRGGGGVMKGPSDDDHHHYAPGRIKGRGCNIGGWMGGYPWCSNRVQ